MIRLMVFCGLASVGLVDSACAEAPTPQPEVLVTAQRTELPVSESLAAVSVITRADIESAGSLDLVDLLRRETGVDVVRGGGFGQQTSVFLRGTNSNHVLVLIDGVRVASVNVGGYAWEHLPLNQIERVEIVRGPRAALYGSDAIGGVIQIFTRPATGIEAGLRAGSHDTYGIDAGFGLAGERGHFGLRAGYTDSRGINASTPDNFSFDPDRDGFLSRNLHLAGSLMLGEQTLALRALRSDDRAEFDQGVSSATNDNAEASLAGPLGESIAHRLSLGAANETLETAAFFNHFDSRRRQLDWQFDFDLSARQTLLLGLAWVGEKGGLTNTFDGSSRFSGSRNNRAVFAGWRGAFAAHSLELATRYDDNSVFGSASTAQAAWGWRVGPNIALRAGFGEGFRAPNFNELYSPGFSGLFAGNPDLGAEHSENFEVAMGLFPDSPHRFELRAFRTGIRDLIAFAGTDFQAINIARARIDGIEASAETMLGEWRINGNATWQDPRNRDSGQRLLRRAQRKANLRTERSVGRWHFGGELHAASGIADFGGNLPGYATLAVNAGVSLRPGLQLDARIDNLLARDYTLVRGFQTPGLTTMLNLRWQR
jgi:vitamin B12 transporter